MSLSHFRSIFAAGLLSLLCALPVLAQNTMVRVHTTQGPIDFKLLDAEAPITVANFLAYVRASDYDDALFHRSAKLPDRTPFVIQGGGYRWTGSGSCCVEVNSRGKIQNEFNITRSNLRGTVAMAKVGSDPNSATSQWFVNLGNNAANLDNQNGGFTVFARVTTPSMVVADRIAALPVVNAGSPYNELPVADFVSGNIILRNNVVRVTQTTVLPELAKQSPSDRIFNYLEAAYPQYLSPSIGAAGTWEGFTYRFYSGSNAYIGTKDGKVWYQVPSLGAIVTELGSMADWLATAQTAGY